MHEERFAHASPQDATEIVTVRAIATGLLSRSEDSHQHQSGLSVDSVEARGAEATEHVIVNSMRYRKLYLGSTEGNARASAEDRAEDIVEQQVACIYRESLKPGDSPVNGPLIIEESYTVLLLNAGWSARVIDSGDLLCERTAGRQA